MEKSNGSTGTLYWYMSPGIVAESDLAGNLTSEYVFFDGERVARKDFPSNAISYYFSDHLKTTDIVTDDKGNIKNESDFYPWGGELQFAANDSNHYKFTGKERDSETGLDYFGARYYSNGLGRFISADWSATPVPVPYADLSDPQSLNLYTYVRNLPTSKADPDGHCGIGVPCPGLEIALQWLGQKLYSSLARTAAYTMGTKEGNQVLAITLATGAMIPEPVGGSTSEAVETETVTAETEVIAKPQITVNAERGAAFEKAVVAETKATDTKVAEQVTLKTDSGVKTRMDVVSTDQAGSLRLQEAKSSATAPLSKPQKAAHPEIEKSGATVVGKGKPDYPGGTRIPPTKVEVVRPKTEPPAPNAETK